MYKVEAIIRSQKLEDLQEALHAMHISGMTVSDVRGMGKQKGVTHTYRGSQYTFNLTPKTKVEIVVLAEELDEVVAAVLEVAQTGEVGDGKIFVTKLEQVIRIRTGERGEVALQ